MARATNLLAPYLWEVDHSVRRLTASVLALMLLASLFALPAGRSRAAFDQSYLVAYTGSALPAGYALTIAAAGGEIVRAVPEIGVVSVRSSDPNFASAMAADSNVWSVGIDEVIGLDESELVVPLTEEATSLDAGADLYQRFQWDIKRVTNNGASWTIEPGNVDTVVAVLDTGIESTHPALAANFLYGKSFVPGETFEDGYGHGTHVAGAIAGNARIRGVGPGLGLAAYKVLSNAGSGYTSWIVAGIVEAANDGVDVINMSLGGYRLLTNRASVASRNAYLRAIRYAVNKNVVVVAAAGNEGLDLDNPNRVARAFGIDQGAVVEVPGGLPGLITVSATQNRDGLAYYSNYGSSKIELASPGGDVGPDWPNPENDRSKIVFPGYAALSSWKGGRYAFAIGTSMAAPKVSAAAALLRAQDPGLKPNQIANKLMQTADDLGKPGRDEYFGAGLVNVYRALGGR